MKICIDSENRITAIVTAGDVEGSIEVDSIPDNVERYKYIDGKFVLNENYEDIVAENNRKEFENAKQQKIIQSKAMLKGWLAANPMLYTNGKLYSVTEEKQSLLNSNLASYERARAAGLDYPLKWNSTGDECVPWSYEGLVALSLAIAAYVAPKVSKQQELEIAIKACETAEELETVVIGYD